MSGPALATPGNQPFIAQRLGSQLGTLAATSAAQPGQRDTAPAAPAAIPPVAVRPAQQLAPGGALAPRLLDSLMGRR